MTWLRVREHLRANRYRLAVDAAGNYPDVPKLAGTPLLTRPEWVPPQPIPLSTIDITLRPAPPAALPQAPGTSAYPSYSAAMSAWDAPAVFENRPTYRLVAASLAEQRLEFSHGTYFDSIDTGEAAAHEYAAAQLHGTPTPLRDAIGDPTVLSRRPANLAISALTSRGGSTFLLHWRDPAKVGHAGGLYQVVPVGVFQTEFSLWRFLLREYAEELLGEPEHDGPIDGPFATAMTEALAAGRIRAHCVGLGVDPLTFATDLLVMVDIDAPAFDAIFGDRVAVNEEGSVTEHELTSTAIDGLPLQAAGDALLRLVLAREQGDRG